MRKGLFKSQNVRLLDVFLLGPFMVWYGINATGVPEWASTLMIISGIGTIIYNGRNYLSMR